MTWQQDMSRAALSIALPAWEWREGDVAKIDADWDPGGTFGGGKMQVTVTVERAELAALRQHDGSLFIGEWGNQAWESRLAEHPNERAYTVFDNGDAASFWTDLMRQGG